MVNIFNKENRINMCIILLAVIYLCITSYIFYNSFQKPEVSNEKSNEISTKIQSIVDPEKKIPEKDFNKYTRKTAHVIEFAAQGISLGNLFLCIYKKNRRAFISLPLFISLLVAVSDEYIQSFNKRTSRIEDVLIDLGGAIAGLFLVFIFAIIFRKKQKRKNSI